MKKGTVKPIGTVPIGVELSFPLRGGLKAKKEVS